ncbi:Mpv17 / PMP22 family protein [Metschnikowia aff. pulcherrima]|uniref:Mpv17 / PMP22 family protein n=1 Tax=Metschnikowia aff. pulcherrima TaxID=2163413 RepID=A0A4P6XHF6_9ASCO|nr:Mpv17 / PMP22 family protein [Metschnikowia aff. pulcherrima]
MLEHAQDVPNLFHACAPRRTCLHPVRVATATFTRVCPVTNRHRQNIHLNPNHMASNIELQDLRNKPFLDVEETTKFHRPKRAYVYVILELVIGLEILYSYEQVAESFPLLAPTILGAASAALAQSLIQFFRQKVSTNRLLKFIVWGCINGCFTALWINVLVTHVDNVAYQILIDQTIGGPLFQLMYTILTSIWENDSIVSLASRSTFMKSLRYSYCYWPFISTSMFILVPPQLMFFLNCLASFVWNLVLSRLN